MSPAANLGGNSRTSGGLSSPEAVTPNKVVILIDEGEEGQVGDKRQFVPRAKANVGRILSEISNNLDDKTSEKNNNPKGVNSSLTIGTEGSKKGRKTFNKPFKEDTRNIQKIIKT
ncbi:hypothetical protein ACOSQ2_032936 [Xanthoceras sorbifolium]